ncbi:lytic transglycosylase domain-containing protein [Rhizobium sp. LCM 4573]|uniref:lytic transglycosylase domain-containing protein n=1 Tax=Rhizobium sp. LCM 4573 TaxID=1848291 RepID=UPI0008D9CBBD|nr:lytic transglycosylase domain-containing protein [Rhizobium sp. LCM 4573]OHV84213.1 hypothetical protein LCM4573_00450 [Rhizobium sp. LCM 4573]
MAINRFFGRKAAVAFAVSTTLAGCSSVEPAKETKLSAAETTAPTQSSDQPSAQAAEAAGKPAEAQQSAVLAKTGRLQIAVPSNETVTVAQAAAMASPEMAPQVAFAADPVPPAAPAAAAPLQTAALAPTAATKTARITQAVASGEISPAAAQAVAPDEEELTPDMVALQSAIPTPRPDTSTLAYAAGPKAVAAISALESAKDFPPAPGDPLPTTASASPPELTKLIRRYAGLYGVPESLVHRVVHRESRYNPKAHHKGGYWGLMQISYPTAKSMGYQGSPEGLLDAETNLKYAVKYLRGAWLVADNSNDNAIRLYARGYYYDAKRRGMLHVLEK